MFKPQNELEYAISDREPDRVIYAICETEKLTGLAPVYALEERCFPDEVVLAVLLCATDRKQLNAITDGWFWGTLEKGSRLRCLAFEAADNLPGVPSERETRLIDAVAALENDRIIRLIEEEKITLRTPVPELLTMLPELSRQAALTLLRDGLEPRMKVVIFSKLLQESTDPRFLKNYSYDVRIMYANLMIRIMAQKEVSAEEKWYPETEESDSEK